ncbi:kelch-like protein 10 [Xenopus laevis]|uniref:Kelch-like protein 10 n=1 Tax=Xenopus laevis TaxID=8355 RepID=A0A8J0U5U0_XENLA|nr:kelch-like protein 10 [Xenopus laevis]OCT57730.1 hypothetical protein XELAEV_18003188mg [Xenopus laevis]
MEESVRDREIFNELRQEGRLCDVIISVGSVSFSAHKIILCGCSCYFRQLFTGSWSEPKRWHFTIPGLSPEMMRLILDFAYTGVVVVTADNVEELFVAADQFNIMGMVRACMDFMGSQLHPENCLGIWKFTQYYLCPELGQKAHTYLLRHFQQVASASHEFCTVAPEDLAEMIESDELNVQQEEALFQLIVQWIKVEPETRRHSISTLLPKVRLALIATDYLLNTVQEHEYVKLSGPCQSLITNALRLRYSLNMNGPSASDFKNPLTRPRLPYNILFAIGGWSGRSPTSAIEVYDVQADRWTEFEGHSPRAYHGAVFLGGFIYVMGGFDSADYFNSVKRFSLAQKTWEEVSPMHTRRCYLSVAVLDGYIYAMGGFDGYVRLNTAERYEPHTNQWSLIGTMHEQRSDASATVLHAKVYICGGFNGNECLSTAEVYSPDTNQWTLIAPMSSRRSGVGVITFGNQIYAVGGFDGSDRLNSAEYYDPAYNSWSDAPPMFNTRSNFGIEVLGNRLYVMGGFNGATTTCNVEYLDEKANEWFDATDMSVFRSALSCCVLPGVPDVWDFLQRPDHLQSSPDQ